MWNTNDLIGDVQQLGEEYRQERLRKKTHDRLIRQARAAQAAHRAPGLDPLTTRLLARTGALLVRMGRRLERQSQALSRQELRDCLDGLGSLAEGDAPVMDLGRTP